MKRLMIAAAAALCASVGFSESSISSANIVGYSQLTNGEFKMPGIGSVFFPVGMGKQYDLLSLAVQGAEEGEYMDPGMDYFRKLDPSSGANLVKYTYVSQAWIDDNFENPKASYWAIGWWIFDNKADYQALIEEDKDDSLMIKEPEMIDVGMAFMGKFDTKNLKIISNGEVPQVVTDITNGEFKMPFFMNYLPVDVDLNDIVVEGGEDGEYMDPGMDYFRKLDPSSGANLEKYTYVSKAWIDDNFENPEASYWAIGWWIFDNKADYQALIEEDKDDSLMIKEPLKVVSGQAFMGKFDTKNLVIKFPSATDLPSNKK